MEKVCNAIPYEQGRESALVQFTLRCTNVPIGTVVSLQSSKPGTKPAIALPPTRVTLYPSFMVGCMCEVPANYTADLTYCYTLPEGEKFPPHLNIELSAAIVRWD